MTNIIRAALTAALAFSIAGSACAADKFLADRHIDRGLKCESCHTAAKRPIVSEPLAEEGPFYATALYPTMVNTQGGPKKNVRGQVMDPNDRPIPRLYAAGELGSMWGSIYQGATNNAECIVFGRIAGREAAKEKAWA